MAFFAASQVALYYALRYVLSSLADTPGASKKSKEKGESLLSQTGLSKEQLAALDLDEYETSIAGEIIPPQAIDTTFESIGGLDEIINSLRETVIYPLTYPELFAAGGSLLSAPRGVLLYGHPGCGKTMLAKALAKESGATFINLPLSSLTSKWFGESNKLVNGLFSLARKVQPSIVSVARETQPGYAGIRVWAQDFPLSCCPLTRPRSSLMRLTRCSVSVRRPTMRSLACSRPSL